VHYDYGLVERDAMPSSSFVNITSSYILILNTIKTGTKELSYPLVNLSGYPFWASRDNEPPSSYNFRYIKLYCEHTYKHNHH
jgi:hypothetical protein